MKNYTVATATSFDKNIMVNLSTTRHSFDVIRVSAVYLLI